MFNRNTLTFNPGWDGSANPSDDFTDVRELKRELKRKGVQFVSRARKAPGLARGRRGGEGPQPHHESEGVDGQFGRRGAGRRHVRQAEPRG
ncbi:MAG TPA: hypothetical protein VF576_06810 [Rubricoccaceae bacterium]|jgi:hypothetical protein